MKKQLSIIFVILLLFCFACIQAEGCDPTMQFKQLLKEHIIETIYSWPVKDQYAIMFFIYPNELNEYAGYSNLPQFSLLYKCESDMSQSPISVGAMNRDEERWNPAFWFGLHSEAKIIDFNESNLVADSLISWYRHIGVQDIGCEDYSFDDKKRYIGKGPNGLPELLDLVTEIAGELQTEGIIESRFGKKIPIILADFEFTWYMVSATLKANPHGEADNYIEACLREGWAFEDQIR